MAPLPPGGPPVYFAAQQNQKRTNLSSKPLKSFNWTKLPPNKVNETIWINLDDGPIHTQMNPEYPEFENLFAAKEIKKVADASAKHLSTFLC